MKYRLVCLLAITWAAVALAHQQRDLATTPIRGTASLAGTLVEHDATGAPVRSATVTLTDADGQTAARDTATDDAGTFAFTGLPAGRYTLSATKPAYLKTNYGATRPERAGTPIVVAAGQQLKNVVLKIWRGGVIAGTLRDPKGAPLSNATLSALTYRFAKDGRTLAVIGRGATDDRGAYRIFGLPPGDYVIAAMPPGRSGGPGNADLHQVTEEEIQRALQGRAGPPSASSAIPAPSSTPPAPTVGYAAVYYPGTTIAVDAATVRIDAGEERAGVDFQLQLMPTAKISGVVVPPSGQSLSAMQVMGTLAPHAQATTLQGVQRLLQVGADGQFSLTGVTPGEYTLAISATTTRNGTLVPGPPAAWWASTQVSIDGHDVPDLSLALQLGITISGRVVFDGASAPPAGDVRVGVTLTPAPGSAPGLESHSASATADRQFTIMGAAPGGYVMSASLALVGNPGNRWTFKSATLNARDVTDSPLELVASRDVSGVVVTFTDHPSEIAGVFQDASGRPAPEYFVIVFPVNRDLWTTAPRRIQQVRPATDGKFRIIGLPAGDYVLAATTDVEPNEWYDPAFLERLLPMSAVRVSLADGEKKTQDIKIGGG